MSNQSQVKSEGFGLGTVLFIVFLILKLTKTIAWSWWWVTAPLWGPFALVVFIMIFVGLFVAIFDR